MSAAPAVPRARAVVIGNAHLSDPCATCDARSLSVCAAIPEPDLARLAALAHGIPIATGSCFIDEGEPAEHFFNVTHGTAKLFKLLPDGRRQITGFAGRGYFLGLAHSDTYAFSAEAVEHVRVCRFSRTKLKGLLDDFPALERRLLEVASHELVVAQEQMLLLGRKTARERVASFLIARADEQTIVPDGGKRPARANVVWLPMTRTDIADYLGLTIETVSRTLSKLRQDGLIDLPSSNEVVLRNGGALEALAAGV